MSNMTVSAPLVNGDLWDPYDDGVPCDELVEMFCGNDLRPPPTSMVIKVTTDSGKVVEVWIPNTGSGKASVQIDGEIV